MTQEPRDEQEMHAELTDEDLENVDGGVGLLGMDAAGASSQAAGAQANRFAR